MNPTPVSPDRPLWRIFRVPLLLGALSAAGLVVALLGDGPWDAVSWAAVLSPIAAACWATLRQSRRP